MASTNESAEGVKGPPFLHQESYETIASQTASENGGIEALTAATSMASDTPNGDDKEKQTTTNIATPEVSTSDQKPLAEMTEDVEKSNLKPTQAVMEPIFTLPPEDGNVDDLSEPEDERRRRRYMRSSRVAPLEDRIRKAPKQVVQITQYTRLMEERVQALEREVRELREYKENEKSEKTTVEREKQETEADVDNMPPPKLVPELRRAFWTDYFHAKEITNSIDVLYGDIEEPADTHQDRPKNAKSSENPTKPIFNPVKLPATSGSNERPSRIRIHSRLLRMELKEVTQYDLMYESREVLAPFKPFVLFHEELRKHQQTLNERLQKLEAEIDVELESTYEHNGTSSVDDTSSTNIGDAVSAKPSVVSETDILTFEEGVRRQDIACLMVRCGISRKNAAAKIQIYDYYESALAAHLLEPEIEEVQKKREKLLSIFEAKVLVEEWKAVIELLNNDLAKPIAAFTGQRSGELKDICFDDLVYLFEPGQLVKTSGDNPRMMRVFALTGGRRLLKDPPKADVDGEESAAEKAVAVFGNLFQAAEKYSPFVVDCFHFDFDGNQFGSVQDSFSVKRFDGLKKISSLPIYPANTEPDETSLKEGLTTRGQKFVSLCSLGNGVHREYDGLSLDDPPEQVDSQVIIDFDMASRVAKEEQPRGSIWIPKLGLQGPTKSDEREVSDGDNTTCTIKDCSICKRSSPLLNDQMEDRKRSNDFALSTKLLRKEGFSATDLTTDDLLLMPNRVLGFVLRSRKWARLNIDNISNVAYDEDNLENLVLPKGHKKIIRALVETHFKKHGASVDETESHYNADIVRGKGKGLIILLHGAPGVGKTSTAECVAEHSRRPLFSITCGDIGETAKNVEENLERCFQLAHRWGCVLLLDEADVFLAQRSKTDLQRNALVSVFLRVLEYYAGILFLTTNRVGVFDEAFKSRIHLSLWYPTLDKSSTAQIWQMNLDRTKEKESQLNLKIEGDRIMAFSKKHWKKSQSENSGFWNGRQIRNAFQTAIAIAQWESKQSSDGSGATLTDKHFEKVSKASRGFDRYLEVTYGGATESQRAFEIEERADHWKDKHVSEKKVKSLMKDKRKRTKDKKEDKGKNAEGVNCAVYGEEAVSKKSKRSKKKVESESESSDSEKNSSDSSSAADSEVSDSD